MDRNTELLFGTAYGTAFGIGYSVSILIYQEGVKKNFTKLML